MSFRKFDFSDADINRISVDHFDSGSITIESGPVVEGSLNCNDEAFLDAIQIRQDYGHLQIELPTKSWRSAPVQLLLRAPDNLTYNLATGSADISARLALGRSKIATGSGDVTLGSATDLSVTAGSGDVMIDQLRGESARLVTGSGDIAVAAAYCAVSAKTGSGDVTVRELHQAQMQASSGSGDISIPATTGSVDLRSASGSLTVGIADDLPVWLDLDSVSGDVRIALEASAQPAAGEPFVTVRARTASGEIAVYRA